MFLKTKILRKESKNKIGTAQNGIPCNRLIRQKEKVQLQLLEMSLHKDIVILDHFQADLARQ